ncbi:MAG TPA: hypothetical protein VNJ28_08850, partial [Candidatus Limnocylindrales bacterium]|nr:hypothetical protein [Candidatus Limnocylindrales bacterium]
SANVAPEQQVAEVERVGAGLEALEPHLEALAHERAAELREAHERVRTAGRLAGRTSVEVKLPVDVLGVYVLLPQGAL